MDQVVKNYDIIVKGRKSSIDVFKTDEERFVFAVDGNQSGRDFRTLAKALGEGLIAAEDKLELAHEVHGPAKPHWGTMNYPWEYGQFYRSTWTIDTSLETTSNLTYTATFSFGNLSTSGTAS